MGAVCVDYDLYGWGESALQVGAEAHHTSDAHTIQAMNKVKFILTARYRVETVLWIVPVPQQSAAELSLL